MKGMILFRAFQLFEIALFRPGPKGNQAYFKLSSKIPCDVQLMGGRGRAMEV